MFENTPPYADAVTTDQSYVSVFETDSEVICDSQDADTLMTPRNQFDREMLRVGLGAAGKKTVLYKLKLVEVVTTVPTSVFNARICALPFGTSEAMTRSVLIGGLINVVDSMTVVVLEMPDCCS